MDLIDDIAKHHIGPVDKWRWRDRDDLAVESPSKQWRGHYDWDQVVVGPMGDVPVSEKQSD